MSSATLTTSLARGVRRAAPSRHTGRSAGEHRGEAPPHARFHLPVFVHCDAVDGSFPGVPAMQPKPEANSPRSAVTSDTTMRISYDVWQCHGSHQHRGRGGPKDEDGADLWGELGRAAIQARLSGASRTVDGAPSQLDVRRAGFPDPFEAMSLVVWREASPASSRASMTCCLRELKAHGLRKTVTAIPAAGFERL